ncbi:ComF family protein [Shewanella sp. UCD-KL12]|uniref:ComF family protein n=1 Tax=Shewanella sp. UCD-KL12 TaxID=1917163 RepID=UPI000970DBE7|nr:double zinc ribbon domain-containing protein [Shewanella sp. UCD-KL12]
MKATLLTQLKKTLTLWAKGAVTSVISLVGTSLPNRCLMCHQSMLLPDSGICPACLSSTIYQQAVCLGCGRGMQVQARYCGSCVTKSPLLVIAPCSYHQGLGRWVGAIKYQGQLAGLEVLSRALIERVWELESAGILVLPQVLVPVPLHSKRLRKRGFNQAWLIAVAIGKQLNIPVSSLGLERCVDTKPQAELTGKQRRSNLSNAFTLEGELAYQRIALIDDVVTTGTTATEIASLFEAKHVHVQVWCLARAEAPGLLD